MNETTLKAVAQIFRTSLSDEPWQTIGFRCRPKYGAIFKRLRPEWKVNLEGSVLKEMIVLFTTAYILAGTIKANEIDEVVNFYADGYGSVTDLFRTIGYKTKLEACAHLRDSIRLYVDTDASEWPGIMLDRLKIKELPDEKLAACIIVGVIRFIESVRWMTAVIRDQPEITG